MKTKTQGALAVTVVPGSNKYYNLDQNGDWILDPYGETWNQNNYNGNVATITYDDTKRSGPLKRTRYCHHTTCDVRSNVFNIEGYTSSAKTRKCKQTTSAGHVNATHLSLPAVAASVHSEALAFFESGCTEREFDLAINLVEWESTLALFRSIKPLLGILKNFLNSKNRFKFLNLSLLELDNFLRNDVSFKTFANLHLSYEFGIKPLIKDIEGFTKSLMSIEEKFAWLRKNQGKPVKVRFSKDLSTVFAPSSTTSTTAFERSHRTIRHYECRYNAYALIVYDVQKLRDAELALRLFARQAGMDSIGRNLWELVPFSFALDWVLDVGTWIESFDPRVTLPYKFLDHGWSLRVTEVLESWKEMLYPIGTPYGVYGVSRKTLFHREPGLPTSFSSVATGTPGAKQLALALSLSVQKFHR